MPINYFTFPGSMPLHQITRTGEFVSQPRLESFVISDRRDCYGPFLDRISAKKFLERTKGRIKEMDIYQIFPPERFVQEKPNSIVLDVLCIRKLDHLKYTHYYVGPFLNYYNVDRYMHYTGDNSGDLFSLFFDFKTTPLRRVTDVDPQTLKKLGVDI